MYSKLLHSKLVNPDEKMDFLAFTRSITTHCLKAAKLRKELPPDIIYPRKRSWKGKQSFRLMKGNKNNILPKHALRNVAECVPKDRQRGVLFVK